MFDYSSNCCTNAVPYWAVRHQSTVVPWVNADVLISVSCAMLFRGLRLFTYIVSRSETATSTRSFVLSRFASSEAWRRSIVKKSSLHQQQRWSSTWVDNQGYEHFGRKPNLHWNGSRAAVLAALTGTAGFSYYWSCREEVPYTHRMHAIMMVSHNMELNIGQQTFQQVVQDAVREHSLLPQHHRAVQMVKHVGMRIAQVAADGGGGGYSKHMRNLDWEFAVIESPDINAFVVPGGKVVVHTGLLRLMQTEDELAAVLAHEVGHVLARHHAERISQMNATGLVNLLLRLLLGISIPGPLILLGMFLPYSRQAEYEADAIGIHLLAKACYDPDANITMLHKLERAQEKQGVEMPPELLSTHPLTQERVQRVRALLPEAFALRQQTCSNIQDVFGLMNEMLQEGFFPAGRVVRDVQ